MIPYAVGIPTCDRPELLDRVLRAFGHQSVPPALIIVVCNNSDPSAPLIPEDSDLELEHTEVRDIGNPFAVPGPEQAHQAALRVFAAEGFGVGVRWDDDLVPEPDCMARMLRQFEAGFGGAVGGCYPRPMESRVWERGPQGCTIPPDRHPGHAQFFRWQMPDGSIPDPVGARHLYSGCMYHVPSALVAGGFCTDYSQAGYRGETDFSLRIGGCMIDPSAIAIHHLAKGGIRTIPTAAYDAMVKHDEALFRRRMTERGIDIEGGYWQ